MRAGIDIGGTYIKAGLIEEQSGHILAQSVVDFPKEKGESAVWDAIYKQMTSLLDEKNYKLEDLPFIGVAVPGSISRDGTTVLDAFNLNFHNTGIKEALENQFKNVSVNIINDANAATLAEHRFGILKGTNTAVLITLGTGVGGGLILGGKLFNGGNGNGVEIGHMTLRYDGEKHNCGNHGCFETYCSADALLKDSGWNTGPDLMRAIQRQDKRAVEKFGQYIDALSSGIVSVINILDPEIIAIGGGISNMQNVLLNPLREHVECKAFYKKSCRIECAAMGNNAGFVGAAIAGLAEDKKSILV